MDQQEYIDMVSRDPLYISSLGLVSCSDVIDFSTLHYGRINTRKGDIISFGKFLRYHDEISLFILKNDRKRELGISLQHVLWYQSCGELSCKLNTPENDK